MKLAVIAPAHIQDFELGYHFALGQELLKDGPYYRQMWERIRRGGFVIVDNGAAEPEEERRPFELIADAAMDMGADEIILPDKLRDKEWTLEHSLDPATLSLVPQHKRFVVPQASHWKSWTECLVTLVEEAKPVTIGVPKWLESLPGGRAEAVRRIVECGYHRQCNIHLLGVYAKPFYEPLNASRFFKDIRGIDTGAPVAYAQYACQLDDDIHHSLSWWGHADPLLVRTNVMYYMEYLARLKWRRKDGTQSSSRTVR
jgi:hypothetical protein